MGAAQLAQTPSGVPINAPSKVLAALLLKRRRENMGSRVSKAAPNAMPKDIPIRFVQAQFTLVRATRVSSGALGSTGRSASKLMAPLTLMAGPEFNFLNRDG